MKNFAISLCFIVLFASAQAQPPVDSAYVANNGGTTVSVIDIDTNPPTVTGTSPVTVGNNPFAVAVTPNGNFVYVTNITDNTVSVFDTATNTVAPSIGVGRAPIAIAITPNGTKAYVVNSVDETVSVINTSSNLVVATIPVGLDPLAIAITPDGTRAYVVNSETSNNVFVINTATDTVIGPPIPVGHRPEGIAIGITSNGVYAYVTNTDSNTVSVINTANNTVVNTILGFVSQSPVGVAITPNGNNAYVANSGDKSVSVIFTATNAVTSLIAVGTMPEGIAITPDGGHVYVTNNVSNSVSVIDTSTNTVTATISAGIGSAPQGIAFALSPTHPPINILSPPTNLTGQQKKNDFGLIFELFNLLKWKASPSAVAGYFVYRDGIKIATVNASTLKYEDHDRKKGVSTFYSVTAVDANGFESPVINVEVQ